MEQRISTSIVYGDTSEFDVREFSDLIAGPDRPVHLAMQFLGGMVDRFKKFVGFVRSVPELVPHLKKFSVVVEATSGAELMLTDLADAIAYVNGELKCLDSKCLGHIHGFANERLLRSWKAPVKYMMISVPTRRVGQLGGSGDEEYEEETAIAQCGYEYAPNVVIDNVETRVPLRSIRFENHPSLQAITLIDLMHKCPNAGEQRCRFEPIFRSLIQYCASPESRGLLTLNVCPCPRCRRALGVSFADAIARNQGIRALLRFHVDSLRDCDAVADMLARNSSLKTVRIVVPTVNSDTIDMKPIEKAIRNDNCTLTSFTTDVVDFDVSAQTPYRYFREQWAISSHLQRNIAWSRMARALKERFRNADGVWALSPEQVTDHDLRSIDAVPARLLSKTLGSDAARRAKGMVACNLFRLAGVNVSASQPALPDECWVHIASFLHLHDIPPDYKKETLDTRGGADALKPIPPKLSRVE